MPVVPLIGREPPPTAESRYRLRLPAGFPAVWILLADWINPRQAAGPPLEVTAPQAPTDTLHGSASREGSFPVGISQRYPSWGQVQGWTWMRRGRPCC